MLGQAMATILTTHEPFLQTRAQVLVLPVSTDGNLLHPVLTRCKSLFMDNYDSYRKGAMSGELMLGQVMLNKVARQQTGLGVQSGQVDYIANLMVQKFVAHNVSRRTLTRCLQALKPLVYNLMRYHGVRRLAFLGSSLLTQHTLLEHDEYSVPPITADEIVAVWGQVFADVPKLTIEIHFAKETPLPQKTLENPT